MILHSILPQSPDT